MQRINLYAVSQAGDTQYEFHVIFDFDDSWCLEDVQFIISGPSLAARHLVAERGKYFLVQHRGHAPRSIYDPFRRLMQSASMFAYDWMLGDAQVVCQELFEKIVLEADMHLERHKGSTTPIAAQA